MTMLNRFPLPPPSKQVTIVKDSKGRILSKKEVRALDKKAKEGAKNKAGGDKASDKAGGDKADSGDEDDGGGGCGKRSSAAEKKAARLARKLLKVRIHVSARTYR